MGQTIAALRGIERSTGHVLVCRSLLLQKSNSLRLAPKKRSRKCVTVYGCLGSGRALRSTGGANESADKAQRGASWRQNHAALLARTKSRESPSGQFRAACAAEGESQTPRKKPWFDGRRLGSSTRGLFTGLAHEAVFGFVELRRSSSV